MGDNRVSATLQTASHVLVVGAGLIYLFGYIIVSLFDATYSIADFTLFRTKVVAVGALFVVLVALAMLLTFRMFSMFGFSMPHAEFTGVPVTDKNRTFLFTDVAISIAAAMLWANVVAAIFVQSISNISQTARLACSFLYAHWQVCMGY
jgi:hypothetical protein